MKRRLIDTSKPASMTVTVIVYGAVAIYIMVGLVNWLLTNSRLSKERVHKEEAFDVADAGVEYYRWHLAHAANDYQDGTGHAGPYYHDYKDKDGNILGQFRLDITAPPLGSTLVTINSTGTTTANPNVKRVIQAKYAIPSLAKYAVVANDNMRFGAGTETFGPIQSNLGIRFDGLAHNLISSALSTYTDPDNGLNEWAVYTQVAPADPRPPTALPSRPDVFVAGRQLSVPAVDFPGLTADLSALKTLGQSADGRYFGPSGGLGYLMVLKTNDTFDLYKVTSLQNAPGGCTNQLNQSGWGTWSVKNKTLLNNYAFPANGVVFLEDHVWIEGQIQTARLTIASGKFPEQQSTNTSITVNNNLLYTTYNGQDVLGLIAQNNFNVGLFSASTLEIDAALIAKNGRAGRYYYDASCAPNSIKTKLTLVGIIGTALRYGFAYTDGTGYTTRIINYDANLLYGPPPSFPLSGNQYQIVSWQEVK
ncbi:MAG: hypothetical protein HY220_02530 [Candidatus Sungbacteria bacterium]|uniref:Type 4 fimbrial biogenesis protein PilX N-terminal domain-containing protein n=1 Tax=Candidatus Sungiibacteriota bacterium TaxID=2750080 RepID=A0A9D6LRW2_9BACT|nr:hypothetical protein [Candidatus Sungbacteria bacterium]